jgi:hypothetical protein
MPSAGSAIKFKRPVIGFTTSGYGPRNGAFHHGIDIAAPSGTPILAVADGVVEQAGWNGGYGNYIRIAHGKISGGPMLSTAYAHASKLSVSTGQKVSAGQVIASVGSTGDSTGPHLHFETRLNGNSTNPAPWLVGAQTVDVSPAGNGGGISNPLTVAKDIAELIKAVTDGSMWIRLAMFFGGCMLLLAGTFALLGKSKQNQAVKLVVSGAKKAGSVSAGEATVAGAL